MFRKFLNSLNFLDHLYINNLARTSSCAGPLNVQGESKGERKQSQKRVGWEGGTAQEWAWA